MSFHLFGFGKLTKLTVNQTTILKVVTVSYFDQALQTRLYVVRKVLGCIHFTDIDFRGKYFLFLKYVESLIQMLCPSTYYLY